MIEPMSEAGALRLRVRQLENDLAHVVSERDELTDRVNAVWRIVNEYFGPPSGWSKPMNGPNVMRRVRKALIDGS